MHSTRCLKSEQTTYVSLTLKYEVIRLIKKLNLCSHLCSSSDEYTTEVKPLEISKNKVFSGFNFLFDQHFMFEYVLSGLISFRSCTVNPPGVNSSRQTHNKQALRGQPCEAPWYNRHMSFE